ELVILDEPLSSLDPLGRSDMMKKISEKVRKGTSVILSSHVTLEVEKMADHIGIINNGQMMIIGSLNEVAKQHGFLDFEIDTSAANITDVFDTIRAAELPLIETPHIVGEKICVKTKNPEEIEKYLLTLSIPAKLHPMSGALGDVYIKEVGGF
ncbi:MAG: hypothetical protein MUP60_04480, partial [Candidatus Thorarchaeota archaeon]|nr:hypothetical protein [Candidatus Thorarchaeota archaeon]